MTKEITMKIDLLAPLEKYVREYKGSHPSKILKFVAPKLLDIWRLDGSKIYEDVIKWDVASPGKEKFFAKWRATDTRDFFTKAIIEVDVQGEQEAESKDGSLDVTIAGRLEVKIECRNFLEEAIRWIWIKMFYSDQIKVYLAESKRRIDDLDNEIKNLFEVKRRKFI